MLSRNVAELLPDYMLTQKIVLFVITAVRTINPRGFIVLEGNISNSVRNIICWAHDNPILVVYFIPKF
jgi:hypothetical protein